jgi:predicted Zn-dependent peptidase
MYQKTVLDNGLTVVSEQIPEFRSCALGIWVGAGSRYETPAEAGLSHLLEHMMFKGTSARSAYDIAVAMDGVGGQINAFTEKEHTCYYARVMDTHVPLATEILSDMMLGSLIDAEELEREKGVILEEIKMYEDTPDDQIFDLFTRAFYGTHTLGRPIIGSSEVVSSISRDQIMDYIGKRYRAGNMLVAAAGHVEHKAFVAMVARQLGEALPTGEVARNLEQPTPVHTRAVFSKDCEQAYLCMGGPGIQHSDPRRYGMLMIDSVLGGSMSSRLFQEIREKRGLAYSVGTFQSSYFDSGIFGVSAGTSAERVSTVLELTRDILGEVCKNGLSSTETERARDEIYHGKFIPLEELIAGIDAVTLEDLRDLAREFLDPERFSLAVLGPLESVEGVKAVPLPDSSVTARVALSHPVG